MMRQIEYTVIAHEAEDGGYWIEVAGLPGAGSQGETLDEAIENTTESIRGVISVMRVKGQVLPVPKVPVLKVTRPA